MLDKISLFRKQFIKETENNLEKSQIEDLRIKYLGRKGVLNQLLSDLKSQPEASRRATGAKVNGLKKIIEKTLSDKLSATMSSVEATEEIDVSLPGRQRRIGSLHLVTQAIEEIARIFDRLGFVRVSYPEVEWEYFAFESLNMPKGHPARDDFETFFIDRQSDPKYGRMLLTPHTSSGQVREMWRVGEPHVKMINISKTYRPNWDASHTPMFHQFEGLSIDEGINITHLKGTIEHFAKEFFGAKRKIRLRPYHFQFTEPSFEIDITCDVCDGKGLVEGASCKICKSGWLELGGAGMVHPNVLKAGNINPGKYTGWAFGFGIERVAMMREGLKLPDIRILYAGDLRFLEQF